MVSSAKPIVMGLLIICCSVEAKDLPIHKALRMIESGNNNLAIGKDGERSAYQITEAVWKIHSSLPFKHYAKDIKIATEVTRDIVESLLVSFLNEYGTYPSLQEFYIMWNKGEGYLRKYRSTFWKIPTRIRDRAQRFENLVTLYSTQN